MTSEEYDKLTDEEKLIKVAELCGWKFKFGTKSSCFTDPTGFGGTFFPPEYAHTVFLQKVPDYLNDLNACHEFEMNYLSDEQIRKQPTSIATVMAKYDDLRSYDPTFATAAQRCKAFVLTMTETSQ